MMTTKFVRTGVRRRRAGHMAKCPLRLAPCCIGAVLCFALCNCRDNARIKQRLETIDTLMDSHSDSALLMLNTLRGMKMSRSGRVMYELLNGKAMVSRRLPYTSDSVMLQVTRYYDRKGDRRRQMEAHYVLANVYLDKGQAEKAYSELCKTVRIADITSAQCDWNMLQSAHYNLARLYETQSSWDKTRYEDSIAEKLSWYCRDTLQAITCQKNMCRTLLIQQDYERCIQESWMMLENCRTIHRFDEGQAGLVLLTESLLRLHRYRDAAECLVHYEDYLNSNPEKKTTRSTAALDFCKGRLCQERGETDLADDYFNMAGDVGKEIYDSTTLQGTDSTRIMFDETEEEIQHGRVYIAFWAVVAFLIAAIAGQSIRSAHRRKHILLQEKNARALHSQIKQLETQNEYLETTITGITQQDRRQEYMSSDVVQYFYKHLTAPRLYPLNGRKWLALKDETERCFPTFYHRTHSGKPISETEYTLCLLTKAGFSVKQINLLMEKEDYASTTRRRLLKKIFGVNGSPADFDRKIHATT